MESVVVINEATEIHDVKSNKTVYLRYLVGVLIVFGVIFYVFRTPKELYASIVKNHTPTKSDQEYQENPIIEGSTVCKVNYTDERKFVRRKDENWNYDYELPIIYFVTPTYPRREQFQELTRLGNTLLHVRNLHWIIADDTESCNEYLDTFLNLIGIPYTHIASPMPPQYKSADSKNLHSRGVANRLASIKWILKRGKKPSVVYFGDDDNTYDLRLFDEIRYTKKVSMFPVGLVGGYGVSSPLVSDGKIIGFFDSSSSDRKWVVDMCGFAVNLEYMEKCPEIKMSYKHGYEEDEFLKTLGLKYEDIELKGNNCTEVRAWHTQTKGFNRANIKISDNIIESNSTNLHVLLKSLNVMGVIHTDPNNGWQAKIGQYGKEININDDNFDSLTSKALID